MIRFLIVAVSIIALAFFACVFAVDAAGKRIGLGDFRPACKGPYGKFVVVKWNEIAFKMAV